VACKLWIRHHLCPERFRGMDGVRRPSADLQFAADLSSGADCPHTSDHRRMVTCLFRSSQSRDLSERRLVAITGE